MRSIGYKVSRGIIVDEGKPVAGYLRGLFFLRRRRQHCSPLGLSIRTEFSLSRTHRFAFINNAHIFLAKLSYNFDSTRWRWRCRTKVLVSFYYLFSSFGKWVQKKKVHEYWLTIYHTTKVKAEVAAATMAAAKRASSFYDLYNVGSFLCSFLCCFRVYLWRYTLVFGAFSLWPSPRTYVHTTQATFLTYSLKVW